MTYRLLTLPEAADRLRRTQAQMRWMRFSGTGPKSALVAGRVMYREADIDTWIDEQFADDTARRQGAA